MLPLGKMSFGDSLTNFVRRIVSLVTRFNTSIDELNRARWVTRYGFWFYFIFGINGAIESKFHYLISESFDKIQDKILAIGVLVLTGVLFAFLYRFVWINVVYFTGRIWNGKASKFEIDTVFAVALIPQCILLLYSIVLGILSNNFLYSEVNSALYFICMFLTIRTLIRGLSYVQGFSFGIAILNIVIPQLMVEVIFIVFNM